MRSQMVHKLAIWFEVVPVVFKADSLFESVVAFLPSIVLPSVECHDDMHVLVISHMANILYDLTRGLLVVERLQLPSDLLSTLISSGRLINYLKCEARHRYLFSDWHSSV